MQLRSYVLYAGSSLWISPSKCLGLEPKWHCHFGIPRQHRRLNHVSTLMVGALWGFVGVDSLKPSTWPTARQDQELRLTKSPQQEKQKLNNRTSTKQHTHMHTRIQNKMQKSPPMQPTTQITKTQTSFKPMKKMVM